MASYTTLTLAAFFVSGPAAASGLKALLPLTDPGPALVAQGPAQAAENSKTPAAQIPAADLAPAGPAADTNSSKDMDAETGNSGESSDVIAEEEEAGADGNGAEEEAPDTPPLFMETYSEGVYSRHEEDNASGFADVKVGKRLDIGLPLDLYAKFRAHRDARDFFWYNHLDGGIGVRANPLKNAFLQVYAEWLSGYFYRTESQTLNFRGVQSRIEQTRATLELTHNQYFATYGMLLERRIGKDTLLTRPQLDSLFQNSKDLIQRISILSSQMDGLEMERDSLFATADKYAQTPSGSFWEARAGIVYWYGSNEQAPAWRPQSKIFPFRLWCDIYSDGTFLYQNRTVKTRGDGFTYGDSTVTLPNFIFYVNPDIGVLIVDSMAGRAILYGTLYAWWDAMGDWWNNRAMAGVGLRVQPIPAVDFILNAEYLNGAYYGRERAEDPNPYGNFFHDFRLGATFWYGLGL